MTIETKTVANVTSKAEGRFTADISRFNVFDAHGDVMRPNAFRPWLERSRALNQRIPVVFSHQANDPMMHVGECNPHNCQEDRQRTQGQWAPLSR